MGVLNGITKNIVITGNESLGFGALKAGLKFYAAYPMTPASSLLHFMAAHERDYKIIVKHTEDELAAMNMTIGASIMGARAMCATSGGGFALMCEGLGFGAIIETPFVCGVITRPGPATGLPTWTGQGDLRFVIHAHQDEFPRIIISPGDAVEAFHLAYQAFNLADHYQIPVIILSDKYLAESHFSVNPDDFKIEGKIDRGLIIQGEQKVENVNAPYARYDPDAKDGISPRSLPGTPGHLFLANSDEHDVFGYSEEHSGNRVKQMTKRMKKLDAIIERGDAPLPKWYGEKGAKTTLVCWGSTKNSCVQAIKHMKDVNVLHFTHMYPLDTEGVKKELEHIQRSVCIECNYSGVFADYLYEKTGYACDEKVVKYDGRPFFVEELLSEFK